MKAKQTAENKRIKEVIDAQRMELLAMIELVNYFKDDNGVCQYLFKKLNDLNNNLYSLSSSLS